MNSFSLMDLRSKFLQGIGELKVTNSQRKEIRIAFIDLARVASIFEKNVVTSIYFDYTSSFFFDEDGAQTLMDYFNNLYGMSVELPEGKERDDLMFIPHFDNFQDIINHIRSSFGKKSEKEVDIKKAQAIDAKRNEDKAIKAEKQAIIQLLNNSLPKTLVDNRIVSIDLEYNSNEFNIIYECGIATLHNGIQTFEHFIVDGLATGKNKSKLQEAFKFGESKYVTNDELIAILKERLTDADTLVGHGIGNEKVVLARHGLNILEIPNLTIIDTQGLARQNFRYKFNGHNQILLSLAKLLLVMGLDFEENILHNAGNDAAYTLKSLVEMFNRVQAKPAIQRKKILLGEFLVEDKNFGRCFGRA